MIKRKIVEYEFLECSSCGQEYDLQDKLTNCHTCNHSFYYPNLSDNLINKYKVIGFSTESINGVNFMEVDLRSERYGTRRFAIPLNIELALRIEHYGINGINDYLEDGLTYDKLVDLEDYQLITNLGGKKVMIDFHKTIIEKLMKT